MSRRRSTPARDRLQRMVDEALPGGRVVSVRRLRGGLSAHVHAVGVSLADGTRTAVVLRRRDLHRADDAAEVEAEFRVLALLGDAGVPVPRPLLLDAEGRLFGVPSIVMSYAGRPLVAPRNRTAWLADLADALVRLRSVTSDRFDLSFLEAGTPEATGDRIDRPLPESIALDPLARHMRDVLLEGMRGVEPLTPCVVHRDFWPGNTVWRRGRLSAIVDWSSAGVGDPRIDIAQCRVDLAMMYGPDVAVDFLNAYSVRFDGPVPGVWFFDLLAGLDDALATFRSWLPGYLDLGLSHLTDEVIEDRLRAFLTASLRHAEAALVAGGD